MANVLPGFSFGRDTARYRNTATGRFVARRDILGLLDAQINSAESRLGELTTALHEGRIDATAWQATMRDELRRLHLQNAALGAGGFDRLGFREYGRVGNKLRNDYQRMTNLAVDIQAGRVTLPQALNRIQGYVGNARTNFFEAERDAVAQRGVRMEERRVLGVAEHCRDCVEYASRGWQPIGTLPVPGVASICTIHCRCSMERREVTV